LLTTLAGHLANEGFNVTAICGRGDYGHADPTEAPNVTIRRTFDLPYGRTKLGRALSFASFFTSATSLALTTRRPDTVLTLTTPPLLSAIGTLVKKLRGGRHFIWEMDVYPDVAIQLGILSPRGPLTRIVGALADWSRRNADGIIALGDDMKDLLIARGIPAEKITVCENWADSTEIAPLPFPDGPLHLLYSGHLGLAHDVDTVAQALACDVKVAQALACEFTFSGAGPQRPALESFCRNHNLTNVHFRPYCPRSELGATLAQCHIGLVTQNSSVIGAVVPSKVYGIMAAGRPVLFIGPAAATPARIIRRFDCGWHIHPGDATGLVALLQHLNANRKLVYQAGHRAHQAFLEHYDRPIGVARIAAVVAQASRANSDTGPRRSSGCGAPPSSGPRHFLNVHPLTPRSRPEYTGHPLNLP